MGHVETDENFRAIVIGSLPQSYDNFINSIMNQLHPLPIKIVVPANTIGTTVIPQQQLVIQLPKISPDNFMESIGQEADHLAMKAMNSAGGSKGDKSDAAFSADVKSGGKGKGSGRWKNVSCFNCKKKGHIAKNCWAKGGGAEGQGPRGKGKPSGETAAAADADTDAAWMVSIEDVEDQVIGKGEDDDLMSIFDGLADDPYDSMPELHPVSNSKSEDEFDNDSVPDLQSVSDSDSESEREFSHAESAFSDDTIDSMDSYDDYSPYVVLPRF